MAEDIQQTDASASGGAQEPPSNPVGRPLKFKTVEELDMAIQLYFDKQDPHVEEHMVASGVNANGETTFQVRKVLTEQKPYTMSGLARSCGLSRQALLEYSLRDDFGDSIRAAKQRCEECWEGLLASPYANGAKFNLQNNYNGKYQPWTDKQVLAGDKDAPLMPIGLDGAILKRRTNGAATSSAETDSPEPSKV